MTKDLSQTLVRGGHALVTFVLLGVFVIGLYAAGLPSTVTVFGGGALAYLVSPLVRRRLLPEPQPLSDEQRLQLPKLRLVWIPLGAAGFVLIYFVAHVELIASVTLIVLSIGALVAGELRLRREAGRRLGGYDHDHVNGA
jgi:hypothetical protein